MRDVGDGVVRELDGVMGGTRSGVCGDLGRGLLVDGVVVEEMYPM
jgi:hypothetical protein